MGGDDVHRLAQRRTHRHALWSARSTILATTVLVWPAAPHIRWNAAGPPSIGAHTLAVCCRAGRPDGATKAARESGATALLVRRTTVIHVGSRAAPPGPTIDAAHAEAFDAPLPGRAANGRAAQA